MLDYTRRFLQRFITTVSSACACIVLNSMPAQPQDLVTNFTAKPQATPRYRSPYIDYELDLAKEKFFIHVPSNYSAREPYGLVVYVSFDDDCASIPAGWEQVLDRHKLIFIAPQRSGNQQKSERRRGLAVLGALECMRKFNIDKRRIYAAGLSGGARIASTLGLNQAELFRGTIQSCGTDFVKVVPWKNAQPQKESDRAYGQCQATPQELDYARQYVRFALITGPGDFRYGYIKDICESGYIKDGFHAKLFDVPTMKHEDCDGDTLEKALDFLARG